MISELSGAEAAFNFEVGYRHDGLVLGRKGGGIVDITVHGVPAHSGLAPEKGRSAVAEMCYKVLELEASRDIERGKLINCGMVSGGIGENLSLIHIFVGLPLTRKLYAILEPRIGRIINKEAN